jgi:hypothetical protein
MNEAIDSKLIDSAFALLLLIFIDFAFSFFACFVFLHFFEFALVKGGEQAPA